MCKVTIRGIFGKAIYKKSNKMVVDQIESFNDAKAPQVP